MSRCGCAFIGVWSVSMCVLWCCDQALDVQKSVLFHWRCDVAWTFQHVCCCKLAVFAYTGKTILYSQILINLTWLLTVDLVDLNIDLVSKSRLAGNKTVFPVIHTHTGLTLQACHWLLNRLFFINCWHNFIGFCVPIISYCTINNECFVVSNGCVTLYVHFCAK